MLRAAPRTLIVNVTMIADGCQLARLYRPLIIKFYVLTAHSKFVLSCSRKGLVGLVADQRSFGCLLRLLQSISACRCYCLHYFNADAHCYSISRTLGFSEAKWVKSEVVNSCIRAKADPLGGPKFKSEGVYVLFTFYTSNKHVKPKWTFFII